MRSKLMVMSAATIDRRLAGDRKRFQIKGRTGTKPGSLLKGQIPIRTFSGWDDTRPGFMQADLVAHCGSSGAGIFCQTLTLTVRQRSRVHQPPAGLLRDQPGHLHRGRPFRKNDSCYVEQKNWAIVHQAVGYARYETDAAGRARGALPPSPAVHQLLLPQAKLIAKSRDGSKVSRRHDKPTTPYQRLLDSGALTEAQSRQVTALYRNLNPAQLRRDIARCQHQLRELSNQRIHTA